MSAFILHPNDILLWGLCAAVIKITLLEGAQLSGMTRLSLPFVLGSFLTNNRMWAIILGSISYLLLNVLAAFIYAVIFSHIGEASLRMGALVGFMHGLFTVTVLLANLPYVHPRMASDYDGPTPIRILEPPGPFGLNYGKWTPLAIILAQTIAGAIFGLTYGTSLLVAGS
jgi:hypothetical protein